LMASPEIWRGEERGEDWWVEMWEGFCGEGVYKKKLWGEMRPIWTVRVAYWIFWMLWILCTRQLV
jgi:hypothetical protein